MEARAFHLARKTRATVRDAHAGLAQHRIQCNVTPQLVCESVGCRTVNRVDGNHIDGRARRTASLVMTYLTKYQADRHNTDAARGAPLPDAWGGSFCGT